MTIFFLLFLFKAEPVELMGSFSPTSRKNMLREAVLWWGGGWGGSAACTVAIRSQI